MHSLTCYDVMNYCQQIVTIQEANDTVSDVIFYSYENISLLPVSTSLIQNAFDALGLMNLSDIIEYEVGTQLKC